MSNTLTHVQFWPLAQAGPVADPPSIGFASLVAIGVVLYIIFKIFRNKRRGSAPCQHRGWGANFAVLLLVILVVLFVTRFTARVQLVERHRAAQVHHATEAARQVAVIEREQIEQVRQLEQAQAAKAEELAKNMSMHQLWEKLHTPRIQLDGNDGRVVAAGSMPEETSESLAASLARLERMVAQATALADRVSEAGTLMGRAMIALNETIDSRARTASPVKATLASAEPKVEPLPVATADAVIPSQRTVEIKFDADKLRHDGFSFDRARSILGKDGYWRGNKVRFDPQGYHIAVTGTLESEFEARLANTLLGTAPKSGRVVHVSDVATVTPHPDTIEISVAETQESAGRPAWVDGPPKRVGNTWREVIVAGEYATKEECNRAADIYLLLATYNHLQQLTGETARLANSWRPDLKFDGKVVMADGEVLIADDQAYDDRLRRLSRYGIGIDFVRREIAKDEYLETVDRSFGPMMNLYTLVEFTPSVDTELVRRWNEYRRDERLFTVGAGAGSVLGMIGLALGLLKVDTWTKGYYSKRLFLGVPAAIIGVLALLGFAAG